MCFSAGHEHMQSPVGNSEHSLVLKLLSNGLLQEFVCLMIHAGSGFINTQDLNDNKNIYWKNVLLYLFEQSR